MGGGRGKMSGGWNMGGVRSRVRWAGVRVEGRWAGVEGRWAGVRVEGRWAGVGWHKWG